MLNSLLVDNRIPSSDSNRNFTPDKYLNHPEFPVTSGNSTSSRISLPHINSTPRFSNGPEVRSPDTSSRQSSERFYVPDEESEHYSVDTHLGYLNLSAESPLSHVGNPTERRPKFTRAQSTSTINFDSSPFTLPNAGTNIISSGFLPAVSPAASSNFPSYRSEASDFPEVFNELSPGHDRGPFPFKKSKTAPKLGVIHSSPLSPSDSPNLKMLTRKQLNHPVSLSPLRDRSLLDPNFLASEVAESVLDTPSNGSTPFGRKFFLQSDYPMKRGLSNSALQPIDISSERENPKPSDSLWGGSPSPNIVSNQCETDDAEEKLQDPALYPDSTNNSPRYFLNIDHGNKLAPLN